MTDNPLLPEQESVHLLDWEVLMQKVIKTAHFEHVHDRLLTAPQGREKKDIEADMYITEGLLRHIEQIQDLHFRSLQQLPGQHSPYQCIAYLEKSRILSIDNLHLIARLIEITYQIIHSLPQIEKDLEGKIITRKKNRELTVLLQKLREIIDEDGQLNYQNHPELRRLYRSITKIETEIRTVIQEVSGEKGLSAKLQYREHDIINDRFVLAIRSDSYESHIGTIISRSSSGMTLFVEPRQIRDLTNKRMVFTAEMDSIIEGICRNFSLELAPHRQQLQDYYSGVCSFDEFTARAVFANENNLVKPELTEEHSIDIQGLFHPLIDNAIPNDLFIPKTKDGLVISGPNTGGKTVLLKSLSLCLLLTHKGLFIPAKTAKIHLYKNVFYFSNDFQNISDGLSSFASESLRYLEMLHQLKSSSLIVVDEIFNSTSSEEASALAMGLVYSILEQSKSKIIISTHHQLLKTLVHQDKRFLSAHMLFDTEQSRPLYQISLGTPGSSLAFPVFNRLVEQFFSGSHALKAITDIAQKVFSTKQVSYEGLLQDLSQKNAQLSSLLKSNRELELQLKNQRDSMQGLLTLEKEQLFHEYKLKLQGVLDEAIALQEQSKNLPQKELLKKRRQIQEKINEHRTVAQSSDESDLSIEISQLKLGELVKHKPTNKQYYIDTINHRKRAVLLTRGAFRMWATPNELSQLEKTAHAHKRPQVTIRTAPVEGGSSTEIDCRGMRLNEFQEIVLGSLDLLLREELPFVTFIHGHGEGVLKSWLREYLKQNKDFSWSTPDGNDGSTDVRLS